MHDVLAAAHMGGIETQLKYRICFQLKELSETWNIKQ
jgi:hypothetical protein